MCEKEAEGRPAGIGEVGLKGSQPQSNRWTGLLTQADIANRCGMALALVGALQPGVYQIGEV